MARVVVTRPDPGLSRTMALLDAMGHRSVAFPLFEYVSLFPHGHPLPAGEGYIVTSAAALRATAGALDTTRPCYAVGSATAEAAVAMGFADVRPGSGDAEGLAALVTAEDDGRHWLYLAGKVRVPRLETMLAKAGTRLQIVEVYDMRQIDYAPNAIRAMLSDPPVDAVLLYSRNAAERFASLIEAVDAFGSRRPAILCLSANVAAGLGAQLTENAKVSPVPDEASLLRLLTEFGNQAH